MNEITRPGGMKNNPRFMQSYNPAILGCNFSRVIKWSLARKQNKKKTHTTKQTNEKMAGKRLVLTVNSLISQTKCKADGPVLTFICLDSPQESSRK